jgi:hypothetical protein
MAKSKDRNCEAVARTLPSALIWNADLGAPRGIGEVRRHQSPNARRLKPPLAT